MLINKSIHHLQNIANWLRSVWEYDNSYFLKFFLLKITSKYYYFKKKLFLTLAHQSDSKILKKIILKKHILKKKQVETQCPTPQ
jgi:hypothetical protein